MTEIAGVRHAPGCRELRLRHADVVRRMKGHPAVDDARHMTSHALATRRIGLVAAVPCERFRRRELLAAGETGLIRTVLVGAHPLRDATLHRMTGPTCDALAEPATHETFRA